MPYLVLRDGEPYSTGTVLASPLPRDMTVVDLTDDEWDAFREGRATWDGKAVVVTPSADPEPDPIEARLSALEAKAAEADALQAVLVDKGLIGEADVAVALEAAPAEVAIKADRLLSDTLDGTT